MRAVAIISNLFAVSDDRNKQNTLTSQAAIVAAIQAAGTFNIGANVRLHWYDPVAATAWLEHARSERFSRATINALPAADQNARVVELWTAFGRYWQCLNVSPYGWARFRRLLEALWGYPSYAVGSDGWKGRLNTPSRNGQYGGAWRQRAHAAIYTPQVPPDQRGSFSPAFGGLRGRFYTSGGNPEFGPDDVVFGTPGPYAIENAGNRPSERGVLPNTNFAPTVEVHRVWLQRNGNLIGGYPRGLDRQYADANGLATPWQLGNFHEPPTNVPGRWDDWTVGFAIPSARGEVAIVDSRIDTQWTVPPLCWYWEILRAAYPLVTGSGYLNAAGYSSFPEIRPVVTATVLDYLAEQGPEAMIREVMFDVMRRNGAMARENGIVERTLADAAGLAEIARQRDEAAPSTAAAIVSGIAVAAGGVVGLAGAGPAGLALGGMVSSAVKLVDALDNSAAEVRRTDVLGRLMPTLDTVAIADGRGDAQDVIGGAGLPSGGGGVFVGLIANIGGNADAMGRGSLSIDAMPHSGQVEVGTAREVPPCRWTDDTLRTWRCVIPTGLQWVRVEAPTGEARLARTEASSAAPATLSWPAMYPEHRYAVAGLPPGSDVFVDGAPAMGTWADAGMTAWEVLMPTGPHAIRLIPPGGVPVLVEVNAQGARSGATWQQLVAAGEAQRMAAAQIVEGGSSTGLWLALAVALGAGGIFYATTQMDGRRANPGKRRRK